MLDSYTFIVVGGGIAGVSCVESLLTWLPEETVLLLSATPTIKATTNAVLIGKTLVQFDVEEKPAESLAEQHPTLDIFIDRLVSIDTEAHEIATAGGKKFKYRKLCVCLGGRPNIIAPGHSNVLGIRDTDSVNLLSEKLRNARRIVICGNGGIASELVYEVKGVEKIWVVKDHHISSVFLDPGAAAFISEYFLNKNDPKPPKRVRYTGKGSGAALGPDWLDHSLQGALSENHLSVEYGATVVSIVDNDPGAEYPVHVVLDSGKSIHTDLVISATGVIPCGDTVNVTPLKWNLASDGGILVDENLSTSVKDVYAAGDVATAGWPAAKQWFQMRLWTQARQMGQYAGRVMTAALTNEPILQDFCFEIFSHVTKFFGVKVILLGLFNQQKLEGDCDLLVRVTPGKEFVKLVMQRGRVQGAVLIGESDLEEMCENLILDQIDVSFLGEHLLDPEVDVDDYFD